MLYISIFHNKIWKYDVKSRFVVAYMFVTMYKTIVPIGGVVKCGHHRCTLSHLTHNLDEYVCSYTTILELSTVEYKLSTVEYSRIRML